MTPKPRYFYRDPLAAAWMHKHFGMKFLDKKKGMLWPAEYISGFFWKIPNNEDNDNPDHSYDEEYFLVHPDSEHILKALAGDTLQWVDGTCRLSHSDHFLAQREKIIMRNGIHFMWPETESTV